MMIEHLKILIYISPPILSVEEGKEKELSSKLKETKEIIPALSNRYFKATRSGLIIEGSPPFEIWERYGQGLRIVEGCIQFLIGDWLNYGERAYGEKYSQALEETDKDYQTLCDYSWVANKIEISRRRDNLSFSHHQEIASLKPEEQDYWLDKIEKENWSRKELREALRQNRCKELSTSQIPEGKFDCIYADLLCQYENPISKGRVIESYIMELEAIKNLEPPTADNAILFLWTSASIIKQALEIMDAWGFIFRTTAIWDKEIIGPGYWFRAQHEILLVGTKGEFYPPMRRVSSVYREKGTQHSKKPTYYYEMIERMYHSCRYLELFARDNKRKKWMVWGNEQ